jgi:hypothetical protein
LPADTNVSEEYAASIASFGNSGIVFLLNVGMRLENYTASKFTGLQS